jgi:PKD repeat protein
VKTIHRALVATLVAALIMLAASCGTGRQDTTANTAGDQAAATPLAERPGPAAGFMSPLEMLKHASAPPIDNDRYREGDDFENPLPRNLVSGGGPGETFLNFAPTWDPPVSAALSDSAYVIYRMTNMTEYAGQYRILLNWLTPPADSANLYLGLGNFSSNAWDWRQPSAAGAVNLPDFAPYTSPTGDMLLVVLLLGTDPAALNWVIAGDALQVFAYLYSDLNGDPALNPAPLTVNFDASSSSVIGANIIGYDWDFDNDGTYEIEGDTTGQASHTYTDPGNYTATVRVVTDQGGAGTDSIAFTAVNPANQQPTAVLQLDATAGDAPLTVNLSSASTDDGTIVKHEWDIDNDGDYDFDTGATPSLQHVFARMGSHTLTLRVTDNDFATSADSQVLTVNTGWSSTGIATNVLVAHEMAMALSGPLFAWKPCVAYTDYTNDDMFFAQATSADGSAWAAPVEPVDNSLVVGAGLAMIAATGAGPLLTYGLRDTADNSYSLMMVRANDTTGASWNPPGTVDASRDIGTRSAMTFLGGIPAILSVEKGNYQEQNVPQFYLATDAIGSAWNPPVQIAAAVPGFLRGISAGVANGLPYLAGAQSGQSSATFSVYSASAADGSAWNPALNIGNANTYLGSTALLGGRPALGGGGTGTNSAVYYVRANGAGADDWPTNPIEVAPAGDGGEAYLAVVAGGPALAWINTERLCVMYAKALDVDGAAWGAPYEITARGSAYGQLRIASVLGQPVICYSHTTKKVVETAWLTP